MEGRTPRELPVQTPPALCQPQCHQLCCLSPAEEESGVAQDGSDDGKVPVPAQTPNPAARLILPTCVTAIRA